MPLEFVFPNFTKLNLLDIIPFIIKKLLIDIGALILIHTIIKEFLRWAT